MPTHHQLIVGLNATPGLPRVAVPRLAQALERWIGMPASVELAASIGVSVPTLERALAARADFLRLARQEHERARSLGARLVSAGDSEYPPTLTQLADPPPVLAIRGGVIPAGPAVAIVGSRRADGYGLEAARFFGRHCAAAELLVVSGLALGVDGEAHRGALDSGRPSATVAILGSGLGCLYPRRHRTLAEQIVAAGGAIVSELAMDTPPHPSLFPIRNRLIAALAGAAVIVQAAPRSGSLVTARLALELGREVLAVPGPIFSPLALGPNALLRDGARPALHPADVLEALGVSGPAAIVEPSPPSLPAEPAARRLLEPIPFAGGVAPDHLAELISLPLEEVLVTLLELELGGWIRREPGGRWRRRGSVKA
jgi:DNA processing protein